MAMKEAAEIKFRAWINATPESIQQDLDTITALRNLSPDEIDALSHEGRVIADEKKLAAPAKPGRPKGSKTRKAAEVQP